MTRAIVFAMLAAAGSANAQKTEVAVGGEGVSFEAREIKRFVFPGRSGQGVTVMVERLSHGTAEESSSRIEVQKPDGSTLGATDCRAAAMASWSCKLTLPRLPASGQYTVAIWPPLGSAASGMLSVSEVQACRLEPRQPVVVNLPRAGQLAQCSFDARAGEKIGFEVGPVEWPAGRANMELMLTLRDPNGKPVRARRIDPREARVTISPSALTVTGTYTLDIDPGYAALASLTIAFTGR